ncbi:MAG: hypothetical protein V4635_16450 [Bacteroidota bacterium]
MVRTVLIICLAELLLSCGLMLIYGFSHAVAYGIMWFTAMSAPLILVFSILCIAGIALYHKIKKQSVWLSIKPEILLIAANTFFLSILAIINSFALHY